MSIEIPNIITWLKDWFYDKNEVDSKLSSATGGVSVYKRYVIELYSDNTCTTPAIEATIDSTIYWLVKAYNIKGEQVPVGEFTLKCTTSDGVTSTLGTCNDSTVEMRAGTYVCSKWGYCRFSIETYATVINITGFKQVKTQTTSGCTYTLYVDNSNRQARLTCVLSNKNIASGDTNYEITNFIPSKYRSKGNVFSPVWRGKDMLLYMWGTGSVGLSNFKSSTQLNVSLNVQVDWTF